MCGIVGAVARRNVVPILIDGDMTIFEMLESSFPQAGQAEA